MIRETVEISRALADPGRLRLLLALEKGELCVCQLVELLDLASSTVSQHLGVLARAGLVTSRKEGRWVHYRLAGKGEASGAAHAALTWAREGHANDALVIRDRQRLAEILTVSREELCRRQSRAEGA